MGAVDVEVAEDGASSPGPEAEPRRKSTRSSTPPRERDAVEVEIEREVTKRQLIQSVTTLLVVLLYMVFTLLRDREAGVVVVDPDDAADDWDES
jgi:hypothetical protein